MADVDGGMEAAQQCAVELELIKQASFLHTILASFPTTHTCTHPVHPLSLLLGPMQCRHTGPDSSRFLALFTVLITTVVGKRNVIKRSYVGFTTCSQGDATFGGGTTWTVKIREDGDFGATLWSFYISQPGYFHS